MGFAIAKIIDVRTTWHGLQYQRIAKLQIEQTGRPPFAGPDLVLDPAMLAGAKVGDLVRIDVRPATPADLDEAAAAAKP